MKDYFNEAAETFLIFVLMGVFTVIAFVSKTDEKLDLRKKFNLFYINTVAGWGIFSLVISIDDWFNAWPQRVFTIMTVTYVGFNTLEFIKKKQIISKIIAVFFKN